MYKISDTLSLFVYWKRVWYKLILISADAFYLNGFRHKTNRIFEVITNNPRLGIFSNVRCQLQTSLTTAKGGKPSAKGKRNFNIRYYTMWSLTISILSDENSFNDARQNDRRQYNTCECYSRHPCKLCIPNSSYIMAPWYEYYHYCARCLNSTVNSHFD